jgi:hypothetical protein
MPTECSADLFGFAPVEGHKVVAGFDGGMMTSEAGAMLLGATDKQIRVGAHPRAPHQARYALGLPHQAEYRAAYAALGAAAA